MSSEQNTVNTEAHQEHKDTSGLVEIQQALDEIEKLQNGQQEESQEEEPEVLAEEENQEAEAEAPVEQEKKKSKIWKEKKRKYQAIAEKEALYQENLQLKQMLSESLNSGTYHYGKSAYADLDKAKENKRRAIEEGDLDSLLEADISLTKAIHTINDLEKWAYTEESRKPAPVKQNNDHEQSGYTNSRFNEREQEIAKDWLEDHQYLDPQSEQYNVNMANKVAKFINDLDVNLNHNGNEAALFTDEYFDHIDDYISKIKKETPKNTKSLDAVAPVGAVRNSYTSSMSGKSSSSPTQMILTSDEKRMCSNAGISEKDWLRYKLEDLKKGK
jgi:hypothetical protein